MDINNNPQLPEQKQFPEQNGGNIGGNLGGNMLNGIKNIKSKWWILAVLAGIVLWGISAYNGIVNDQQEVEKAWANVEAQYQRRADLVENLVNTVKGYAKHERETFEAVTNARTSVGSIKIDNIDDLDPEKLQQFQKAQSELGGALKSLIAVSENYPDLKASEEFTKLQDQLESTENRIAMVREDFNKAAKDYNTKIKSFPKNIFAGIFGFKEKPYFKSEEGSEKAPKVSFE